MDSAHLAVVVEPGPHGGLHPAQFAVQLPFDPPLVVGTAGGDHPVIGFAEGAIARHDFVDGSAQHLVFGQPAVDQPLAAGLHHPHLAVGHDDRAGGGVGEGVQLVPLQLQLGYGRIQRPGLGQPRQGLGEQGGHVAQGRGDGLVIGARRRQTAEQHRRDLAVGAHDGRADEAADVRSGRAVPQPQRLVAGGDGLDQGRRGGGAAVGETPAAVGIEQSHAGVKAAEGGLRQTQDAADRNVVDACAC